MPFYEYRPKSGVCGICDGCFVDLQKMSEAAHEKCPDCGQECERVIAMPIVSVRGAEYRAAANKEKRTESYARAGVEVAKMRDDAMKKMGQISGHTHNCALAGCFGSDAKTAAEHSGSSTSDETHRFGGLPHLVGVDKK
jgi:putative FmdB family regulatory protein